MSNRTHPTDSTADEDGQSDWTVTLPTALGSRIDQRLSTTEFDSVEEYVTYAMGSLLREIDELDGADGEAVRAARDNGDPTDSDGSGDSDSMEDRLEALGYL